MMDKKQRDEYLDKMTETIYSKCLIDYLEELIKEIDSVDGVLKLEDAIGKQIAKKYMKRVCGRIKPSEDNEENFSEYE